MMKTPTQRSPLFQPARDAGAEFAETGGWEVVQRYPAENPELDLFATGRGVAIADESANGKLMVEGNRAAAFLSRVLGIPAFATGDGISSPQGAVYRLRADQFLLHTFPGTAQAVEVELNARMREMDGVMIVTDITHGRSEMLLLGPDCPLLLSRLCGLNFDGDHYPAGTARQSSVAKTRQIIIREDIGLYPAFRLIGARSLATYLWQTILEAGQDLGIIPIGKVTRDTLS